MKRVLLTNDDSYLSVGYYPFLDELKKHYDVTAITPESQTGWLGKSMSYDEPIDLRKTVHKGHSVYVLNGTPADCVQVGLYNILKHKPDFVVSGINIGYNTSVGILLSSGTIGAAIEGSLEGVTSIAFSLCDTSRRGIDYFTDESEKYFKNAVKIAAGLVQRITELDMPEEISLISVNIPFDAPIDAPVEVTVPSLQPYGQVFEEKDNRLHHTRPNRPNPHDMPEGTDVKAVAKGHISVTPLDLTLASRQAVNYLSTHLEENL